MSSNDKHQANQRDIRNDGRIVIFQRRRDTDGSINPTWYMRLLLPNQRRYFKKSTRTTNEFEAGKVALQTYEEFQVRALAGSSIHKKSFNDVFEEWAKVYPNQSSNRPKKYIEWGINRMRRNACEFFVHHLNDIAIEELNDNLVQDFYVWRRENTFRNGKKHIPADDTLRKEMNLLNAMLNFAHQKKYILEVPKLNPPKVQDNRRPAFSGKEWEKLYTEARKWVKEAEHTAVRRDRFYLQHYILILANSGIRVGEARELKWGNIRSLKTPDGNELVANVVGKTSTSNGRDVVMNPSCERYLERLYDWRRDELGKDPDPSEPIFCHKDGTEVGSLKKSFASLLKYSDLTFNTRGQKRTIYSLRHTYATMALNRSPVYFVAKNMGTSVKMIERFYEQSNIQEQAAAVLAGVPRRQKTTNPKTKKYPFRR